MKLVAVVIASLLALPDLAHADEVLNPPSGPVYVEVNNPGPGQNQKNHRLKEALMEQFDMNGDGRLGPRERMRAVRVLARIQRKLAGRDGQQGGKEGRQGRMKKFIQRFDTNHDGNVDQSEMPPGAARKMRRFDRDRDGWVEPGEAR